MTAESRSRVTVGPQDRGTRLDAFLAGPIGSRSSAQSLIEAGLVRVDGQPARKRHLVQPGEVIEIDRESFS